MKVSETAEALELYFPPLRATASAFGLGLFGVIASALAGGGMAAVISFGIAETSGLVMAVLLATVLVPFTCFGVLFVLIAVYMAFNALYVRVTHETIATARALFGVTVARHAVRAHEIGTIEPQIASRDQVMFSAAAVYRLIAVDHGRTRRIVVAETLKGEGEMERVKALIESYLRGKP